MSQDTVLSEFMIALQKYRDTESGMATSECLRTYAESLRNRTLESSLKNPEEVRQVINGLATELDGLATEILDGLHKT